MCENPIISPDGQKLACRKCNQCIAVKKWDWVARAVAETATAPWAGVVSLSYDGSEASADGRVAFRYRDIQNWLKRLRLHAPVRYLCAGERGSAKGRVHWHVILWGPVNLFNVGKVADFDRQYASGVLPSQGPQERFLLTNGAPMRTRLVWDHWPFGHVFFDVVDQNTAEYVVKYTQKAQHNAVRSRGTRRFTKSEVSAAGMFRMSKKPPLGSEYLRSQIDKWCETSHVPPSGRVTIPGLKGNWYPRASMREVLLDGLAEAFAASAEKRGLPPHGWTGLLAEWSTSETGQANIEALYERIEPDGLQEAEEEAFAEEIRERGRARDVARRDGRKKQWCQRVYPCNSCLASLDASARRDLKRYGIAERAVYLAETAKCGENRPTFDAWSISKGVGNPFCRLGRLDPPEGSSPTDGEKLYRHSIGERRKAAAQRPSGVGRDGRPQRWRSQTRQEGMG